MKFQDKIGIEDLKLDMTPLIDVVFQLLIFFMLSSSFVFQTGIKINLPKSEFNEAQKPNEITVSITEDNRIYYNEFESTIEGIKLKFDILAKTEPDTIVVIKADESVAHGKVVELMGIAKNTGLNRLAIATAPPAAG